MELSNIEKLVKSVESGYEIIIQNVTLLPHIISMQEEMRLDLVSYNIYNNEKYVPEITYLNGYTNIFSVKRGDVLLVPHPSVINNVFNFNDQTIEEIRAVISKVNKNKIKKIDKNRATDLNNRDKTETDKKLPPTIKRNDKIVIENGKMIIKTNF